jgi:hypothetical protein
MNWRTLVYSMIAAGVTTAVAHHAQFADVGLFLLTFAAHFLHVPVTAPPPPPSPGGINGL